jgi:hypothetical protein
MKKMSNIENPVWPPGGKPTEAARILVSERLSALLPKDEKPIFVNDVGMNYLLARVFNGSHYLQFLFLRTEYTHFVCSFQYCVYLSAKDNPVLLDSYCGDTLEEVIDCAFTTVYPHFLDMCSKIAETGCTWTCMVCGFLSDTKVEAEVHCLKNHPYSTPVKSAGKI